MFGPGSGNLALKAGGGRCFVGNIGFFGGWGRMFWTLCGDVRRVLYGV